MLLKMAVLSERLLPLSSTAFLRCVNILAEFRFGLIFDKSSHLTVHTQKQQCTYARPDLASPEHKGFVQKLQQDGCSIAQATLCLLDTVSLSNSVWVFTHGVLAHLGSMIRIRHVHRMTGVSLIIIAARVTH